MIRLTMAALALALALAPLAALAQDAPVDPNSELPVGPYLETLRSFILPEDQGAMEGWEKAMRDQIARLVVSDQLDPAGEAAAARMTALLDLERQPFDGDDLIGDWSFKSYQVDALGAYEYSFFNGRIYPEGQALILDKSGGSQKHFGMMAQASDDALLFLGAISYSYDTRPRLYSGMEAEPDSESRERDEIAELYWIGDDRYLMAFAPRGERFRLYEIVPR